MTAGRAVTAGVGMVNETWPGSLTMESPMRAPRSFNEALCPVPPPPFVPRTARRSANVLRRRRRPSRISGDAARPGIAGVLRPRRGFELLLLRRRLLGLLQRRLVHEPLVQRAMGVRGSRVCPHLHPVGAHRLLPPPPRAL